MKPEAEAEATIKAEATVKTEAGPSKGKGSGPVARWAATHVASTQDQEVTGAPSRQEIVVLRWRHVLKRIADKVLEETPCG